MQKIVWNSGSISLVVANMLPLFGALFLGWSLSGVVFLYWLENVVVGIFNVARMVRSTGVVSEALGFRMNGRPYVPEMKRSLILFFIFHYGLFTFGHGLFVITMFGWSDVAPLWMFIAFCSLFISHGISYGSNFIGKREFERVSAPQLFIHPYKRIVVLHLTVIFGGFLAQSVGWGVSGAFFLIGLKTAIDLAIHLWEHRKFGEKGQIQTA